MKSITPELRFKDFTDTWIEIKIDDIFERVSHPVSVQKKELYKQIGIRSHGKGIFYKKEVTGEELGNKRVFWVVPNTFVVNIVFAWERAVAKLTINEKGMIASHRFPMYRPLEGKLDLDYITLYFITEYGHKILQLSSPGGAGRNKTLGQSEFIQSKILLPSLDEQKKIADFINKIDERISIQQSIINDLLELRISVTNQIFNQEIRFLDEDNNNFPDWEEIKLGKLGFFKTSSIDKLTKENERLVKLVNYMDVYKHKKINSQNLDELMVVSANDNQITENNLIKGDILITPSSETPDDIGHTIAINEDLENTVYSYHLVRFRPIKGKLDSLFSNHLCNNQYVMSQFSMYAQGATRFTLSISALEKVSVRFPQSLIEQRKIAEFFDAFDKKIETEKAILADWEDIKKSLLQQMFV
jgi:type I restriction enzyme S subunit